MSRGEYTSVCLCVVPREVLDIWDRVSMQEIARIWAGRALRKQLGTFLVPTVHYTMNWGLSVTITCKCLDFLSIYWVLRGGKLCVVCTNV